MLKDRAKEYFIDKDFNCAETVVRCIRDEYALDISEDDLKLVSGFGGGMGCGQTCGALCGLIAAYGKMTVKDRAHATADFGKSCGAICGAFNRKLGSMQCAELKKLYSSQEFRCLKTVEMALDIFEEFMAE